jgi:hypothetical protein
MCAPISPYLRENGCTHGSISGTGDRFCVEMEERLSGSSVAQKHNGNCQGDEFQVLPQRLLA